MSFSIIENNIELQATYVSCVLESFIYSIVDIFFFEVVI